MGGTVEILRCHILLVEDDRDDYVLIRDLLDETQDPPCDLQWADTFEAGLEIIAREAFDVILVDYYLGLHNGLDYVRRAKAAGSPAPIILLSGLGNIQVDREAMRLGAADYLAKGHMDAPLLARVIRHALERQSAEYALRASEERYRRLFDDAVLGIFQSSLDGRLLAVNPAWARMFGYASPAQALAAVNDVAHQLYVDPALRAEIIRRLAERSELQHFECRYRRQDGTTFLGSLHARMIQDARGIPSHLEGLVEDITELKQAEERLRALSLVDDLTGLYNRRGFLTLAEQQLKTANRFKQTLALLFCDVDHLKQINDTQGHAEGDRALVEIAGILKTTFREADIIARLGGDEFVILAAETSEESAAILCKRVLEHLQRRNSRAGSGSRLALSIGLSLYDPETSCSLEELIDRADHAMYAQKHGGRPRNFSTRPPGEQDDCYQPGLVDRR